MGRRALVEAGVVPRGGSSAVSAHAQTGLALILFGLCTLATAGNVERPDTGMDRQLTSPEIVGHVIAGGGTLESFGDNWNLAGTTGQYDASEPLALTTGNWQVTGGFWSVASELPETGNGIFFDHFELFLPQQ